MKNQQFNYIDFHMIGMSNREATKYPEIKSLDTFLGSTKNFNPDGLYSTTIFGPSGSEERDETFAVIKLNTKVLSPMLALALFDLKQLYKEICQGTRLAVWDAKAKDFEPAKPNDPGADTGYDFFMSHVAEIKPPKNDSPNRNETIDYVMKWKDYAVIENMLVLPAGLRDLMIKSDGSEQEDEINPIYRKILSLANVFPPNVKQDKMLDAARWKMQLALNSIVEHFYQIISGKKGHTRGKTTARRLVDGTRNVLSGYMSGSRELGAIDEQRPTDTLVGLYQTLKALLPIAQYHIRTKFMEPAQAGDGNLYGYNSKTFKREFIDVDSSVYDLFTTDEGIERLINRLEDTHNRHKPLMIDDKHYLALVYVDDKSFKIVRDIDQVPSHIDRKLIRGATLSEVLYLAGFDIWNDYFMYVTRYPIAGNGSIYSSTIRLVTTVGAGVKYLLNDEWQLEETKERAAISYPKLGDEFFMGMAPHPTRIDGLKADYDGDTGSGNAPMSIEALEENRKYIHSKSYWYDSNNKLRIELTTDVINRVFLELNKVPENFDA